MFDLLEESRVLATGALSQLVFKDSSTTAGVRSVLRIATLRARPWWQVWAYLQLSHMDTAPTEPTVVQMLDDAFGDSDDARNAAVDSVFADLVAGRQFGPGDNDLILISLDEMEARIRMLETRVSTDCANIPEQQDEHQRLIRVVTQIKNRAQVFLMGIERGAESPSEIS